MAEGTSEPIGKPRGFIAKTIDLFLRAIGILIFSAVMSIVIEWVQIAYYYPEGTGYKNAELMYRTEVGYLTGDKEAFTDNQFLTGVSAKANGVIQYLFVDSGVLRSLQGLEYHKPTGNKVSDFIWGILADYYAFAVSAVYMLSTFTVRLGILVLSLPAFVLFGIVGLSDGLAQRDLRRWRGGNESGYVYHWAKRLTTPILFVAWVLYLSIPMSIHPNFIITPFAVLYGIAVMVMASKFKKYL